MHTFPLQALAKTFDAIEHFWDMPRTQRRVGKILFWIYIAILLLIEANRNGLLPSPLERFTPVSHFASIQIAFTLILGMEVLELICSISSSFSKSVGKQFEILALILLRNAFKELSNLPEPVILSGNIGSILHICTSATGALCIFIALGFYFRVIKTSKTKGYMKNQESVDSFVTRKKVLALFLLLIFFCSAFVESYNGIVKGSEGHFFEAMYTLLIFSDIAIVLLSQCYMPSFHAIFRNSGYVVGTLLMRLALSAEHPYDSAISVFAAAYILALTVAVSYFPPQAMDGHKHHDTATEEEKKEEVGKA